MSFFRSAVKSIQRGIVSYPIGNVSVNVSIAPVSAVARCELAKMGETFGNENPSPHMVNMSNLQLLNTTTVNASRTSGLATNGSGITGQVGYQVTEWY